MTPPAALLTFRLGDQFFALPIPSVVEVAAMVAAARIPGAPSVLVGVVNRHGVVVPLLDVRQIFGLPPLIISSTTLFIVVHYADRLIGLVVDEIFQVQYYVMPTAFTQTGKYVSHVLSDGQQILQVLALAPLVADYLPYSQAQEVGQG
jgi:purine-binding chemotaxis protein CheW